MTGSTRLSRHVRKLALTGATLTRGERGAAIVEMALVLPLLLALLIGILVYGQYFMLAHNVQQAARMADYAAVFLQGELIEFSGGKEIFLTPRDKRTQDYVMGRFG